MRIPESELIINGDGSAFHLHIRPETLADNIILVGDPGRISMIKKKFDSIEDETSSREFISATGTYKGKRFTALSTGIGSDNIDIVMTELDALANIDFKTREVKPEHRSLNILRIGTCGAVQPDIPIGSYILSHISIGFDGLMNWYENRDEVTIPDMEKAFKEHMNWNEYLPSPYFARNGQGLISKLEGCTVKGMTIAAPGFYGPQGRVVRLKLAMPDMLEKIESFRYDGYRITNFEMEGSALAGLATHLGHNAATVCCAIANRYLKGADTDYKPFVNGLVDLALNKLSED